MKFNQSTVKFNHNPVIFTHKVMMFNLHAYAGEILLHKKADFKYNGIPGIREMTWNQLRRSPFPF